MIRNTPFVITIGRQFGSGGREIGRALAKRLGIEFYDKRLLVEAAKHAGLSDEIFNRHDEKYPRFISGLFSFAQGYMPVNTYVPQSPVSGDRVQEALGDFIRRLASTRSCVIVGRTADYALKDHPNLLNIFVHAPKDVCAKRILERGDAPTLERARAQSDKTNRLRAQYYNFYTDKRWGDSASYDLSFDSSLLPVDQIVDIIVKYIEALNAVKDTGEK